MFNVIPKHHLRRGVFGAAVALLCLTAGVSGVTTAGAHEVSQNGITVAHPWVRATPGESKITAAYLEIKSEDAADRLVGGSAEVAGRVEIHTHEMDGDVMRMRRVDGLDIAAGASRVLKPSGDHVMLMDLKNPLKEGDLVKLKLNFEKAGVIEVEATVEPVGAMGPHGMDHQPGHDHDHDSDHDHSHDHGGKKSGSGDHHHDH